MGFKIGEGYTLFFGRMASAPTTPLDPENASSLFEIGEIPDALDFDQVRAMINRFDRDSPGQTFKHPGRRDKSVTFNMNIDVAGNTGITALQGCMDSNTDGFSATGNIGYFAISNGVASDRIIHGQAGVSNFPHHFPAQGIVNADVTLAINGDPTVGVHA